MKGFVHFNKISCVEKFIPKVMSEGGGGGIGSSPTFIGSIIISPIILINFVSDNLEL